MTTASHPAEAPAWDDPATRRNWRLAFAWRLLGPLAVVAAVTVLFLILPPWGRLLFALFVVGGGVGAAVTYGQVPCVGPLLRVRRVLRTYPWQIHENGLPHGPGASPSPRSIGVPPEPADDRPWFRLPKPDETGHRATRRSAGPADVEVRVDRTRGNRWWLRQLSSSQDGKEPRAGLGTLCSAGDPRFAAVLAVPSTRGPRRLLELPSRSRSSRDVQHPHGASDRAVAHAAAAGVRFPELALPLDKSGTIRQASEPPPAPAWSFPATRRSMVMLLLRHAVLAALAPLTVVAYLVSALEEGAGKGLILPVLLTVLTAQGLWSRFTLVRKLRGEGRRWKRLDVEIRHRRQALVLVTGNEALRAPFALRKLPEGRAQVWYVGDIYGKGMVSLRGDGAVLPVKCAEHGRPVDRAETARNVPPKPKRRWGPVG